MNENKNVSIQVRIDRLVDGESSIKAFASVTLGGVFVVHDIRVSERDGAVTVRMPFRSYKAKGETKYVDTFHPITTESRVQLVDAVKDAYAQALEARMAELERSGMSQRM